MSKNLPRAVCLSWLVQLAELAAQTNPKMFLGADDAISPYSFLQQLLAAASLSSLPV